MKSATGGTQGTYSEIYTYNSSTGNLASKGAVSYTYGDSDHKHAVTSLSSGWTYQYDPNGNMTERNVGSSTYSLTYDAYNHLVSVSGAGSASFDHDGNGDRVKVTTGSTTTAYIGNYYEWNLDSSTATKYYYAGVTRVAMREGSSDPRWMLSDQLGSTSVVANYNGSLHSSKGYKAWGESRFGDLPTAYQFTGQFNQEVLGLYYYEARYYDPVLGRFTQADTLVPNPGNTLDWDRYSYVRNNPVRYIDPTGHWTEDELEETLGEDWYDKYFGENAVFQNRDKLIEFLLSENTTDPITLGIVSSLLNSSYEAHTLGIDFSRIDALGVRGSAGGGGVGFFGGSVDAILNITSGEFSVFGSLEGGFMAGASITVVGGISLIKNMPANSGFRGTCKNVGGMGGYLLGFNIEGFSGGEHYFQDSSDVAHGLFVGVGGTISAPNAGVYGSLSYAGEILNVNQAGYRVFPNYPGPIKAIYDATIDIGEVLWHDILNIP